MSSYITPHLFHIWRKVLVTLSRKVESYSRGGGGCERERDSQTDRERETESKVRMLKRDRSSTGVFITPPILSIPPDTIWRISPVNVGLPSAKPKTDPT